MKKEADDAETAIIGSSEKVILDLLERDISAHPDHLQSIDYAGASAIGQEKTPTENGWGFDIGGGTLARHRQ